MENSEFLVGALLGVGALYYLYSQFVSEKIPVSKVNRNIPKRKYSPEDLVNYNGEGFKVCFVSLNEKIYDVTPEKHRFMEAGLAGKSLSQGKVTAEGEVPNLVKDFLKIGLSVKEITEKFPVVGELLVEKEFTLEELKKFDGKNGSPVYIGAKGMVFEVDPGFYGPGGPYGLFAGRDASRALAKVSLDPIYLESRELGDLSALERQSLDEWVAKFEMKYTKVGYIKE